MLQSSSHNRSLLFAFSKITGQSVFRMGAECSGVHRNSFHLFHNINLPICHMSDVLLLPFVVVVGVVEVVDSPIHSHTMHGCADLSQERRKGGNGKRPSGRCLSASHKECHRQPRTSIQPIAIMSASAIMTKFAELCALLAFISILDLKQLLE